ncbi:PD-(D/E)XK nuclease family protein [Bifidobacterium parmae]|uniref:PD-(D/E)XK nuclease superfamily n=1 Tax=Bifidobacterium parmae TaxID=361854 RepID=A0A2N5J4N8_9BIFI|nr:PD-(D/E)XK nuclease family protein [Bifidobacterium parmae]PLS29171.1 PD-(D/E)XK nuclease superfamily [Bifidobacterium parmae]
MSDRFEEKGNPMGNPRLGGMLDRVFARPKTEATGVEHVYVITPARLRSHMERETLRYLRDHAAAVQHAGAVVDVHSFTSFVRSVIGNRDEAASMRPTLSPFVLRAFLAREMSRDQSVFRKAGRTFGSVNQFASQIEELRKAGVTSADLERLAAEERDRAARATTVATASQDMAESGRFNALRTLLSLVEQRFGERYALPGEIAPVVEPWLRLHGVDSRFLLIGFEWFAPSEALALQAMLRYSQVDVDDVTASGAAWHGLSEAIGGKDSDGYGPLEPVMPPTVPPHVLAVDDPAEEVRFAADDIARHVRESAGSLSYGDILVTARDLDPYRALLDTEFTYRGVPVNATPAAMMVDDPVADVVLGLLDPAFTDRDHRDPTAVMRVLRTGLLRGLRIPDSNAAEGSAKTKALGPSVLDRVENMLAESDPKRIWDRNRAKANVAKAKKAGYDADVWNALIAIDGFIDAAKGVVEPKSGATVRAYLTGLVSLLADYQVNKGLRDLNADHADRDGRALLRSRRTWDTIMAAFDELVGQFGDEPFDGFASTFRENLASLLAMEPSGARPKALNAVDVATYPTPMRPYRLVYVLGASETQLPAVPHETGLLDDSERETLADDLESHGRHVEAWSLRAATVDAKARREPTSFNLVTGNATEQVTVTWPRTMDGAAQQPSAYAAAILGTSVEELADGKAGTAADADDWAHDIDDALIDVPSADGQPPLDRELATLLFTNHERPDDPTSPLVFDASVSAIEQYYANPYDYFLQRGLRIKPIRPYELDSMLEGSYYHAVLEHALDRWMRRHPGEQPELEEMQEYIRDYARLDRSDATSGEPDDDWTVLDDDARMSVLDSSNRMRAVRRQLEDRLLNMAVHMDIRRRAWGEKHGLKYGTESGSKKAPYISKRFIPMHAERQFGDIHGKPGHWAALSEHTLHGLVDGREILLPLHVNGKIDRIDRIVAPDDAEKVPESLLILDYKSSVKPLFGGTPTKAKPDANRGSTVYAGRELQLFTYARVALQQTGLPVAGLYFLPIKLKNNDMDEIEVDKRWKQVHGRLQYGLASLDDGGQATAWGMNLTAGGTSIVPWKVSSGWPLDSQNDFDAISAFVQHRIHEACDAVMAGDVKVAPYRKTDDDDRDGTTFSDYADVFALDLINGEAFHKERQVSRTELINAGKALLAGVADASEDKVAKA